MKPRIFSAALSGGGRGQGAYSMNEWRDGRTRDPRHLPHRPPSSVHVCVSTIWLGCWAGTQCGASGGVARQRWCRGMVLGTRTHPVLRGPRGHHGPAHVYAALQSTCSLHPPPHPVSHPQLPLLLCCGSPHGDPRIRFMIPARHPAHSSPCAPNMSVAALCHSNRAAPIAL